MAPSRVTTRARPTSLRSPRFCLACPRLAIGARSLAESMNVAKFVMSSASPDRSKPNSVTIAVAIAASAAASLAVSRASIASQNRRWSVAATGTLVNRGPAVVAHHCSKASFEHGATTRFKVASARYVPTDAPASERRGPHTSSIASATPSRSRIPQTAATPPNALWWVRSGRPAAAPDRPAITSWALPRYSCATMRGFAVHPSGLHQVVVGLVPTLSFPRLMSYMGNTLTGRLSPTPTRVSAQVKPGIRPKQWSSEPAHELASQEDPARTRGSHCGTAQARGWVVVTSGASLPLARVAWLGFDWREERFELLDILLQLDHLELTPAGQPLELL